MHPGANINPAAIEQNIGKTLLASLVNASPAVLYSCRVTGDCGTIAVTTNAERVFGYSPEEFIEDPSFWAVRIHPEDSARVFEELPHLFREGRQVIEYRFRHADGRYLLVRDHMTLERNLEGGPERILGCWLEIGPDRERATSATVFDGSPTLTATTTEGGRHA